MIRIGVDFGGTKIEAAALNADGGFLARVRVPNPGDYDQALLTVRELVERVEAEVGSAGTVGVGLPGSISPRTGLMRNANSTYLNGRTFREDLSAAMGREVRVANDANCLALSEAVDGAVQGAKIVFAIIVGTGCGGGLVVDGQLLEGANGIGGEWGHMPLPWPSVSENPGPKCWCGKHGCLETWVSGTGFRRDYAQAQGGRELTGEAIIEAARNGQPAAAAAFDRLIRRLGRAIAVVCNLVDPDAFVIGGGLSNVAELFERLPDAVRPFVFSDAWEAKIVPARWGDSSGVRGAARLWSSSQEDLILPSL
jgi:fructokinase